MRLVAMQPGPELNDITVFFGARRYDDLSYVETGYQFKFGAYDNTASLLLRAGQSFGCEGHHAPLEAGL